MSFETPANAGSSGRGENWITTYTTNFFCPLTLPLGDLMLRSERQASVSKHKGRVRAYAACFSSSAPQMSMSAATSRSIASSSCSGVGVRRSRSVPRGTVG